MLGCGYYLIKRNSIIPMSNYGKETSETIRMYFATFSVTCPFKALSCYMYMDLEKQHLAIQVSNIWSVITKASYKIPMYRVRNCAFLVANATKNFALATRISQLVASGRLTISCHDNYTNNNFDFQPNRLK